MAYFRCATGGGAGATITVTYTSDFYGETITCTHGTKSYSKVATSSGTVEFTVGEEGTWTISCLGFTDTADVDLSYSADLVAVPDGSTVLPTDDIEMWLACGQITGKSYTTLSQVLADAETYERLLSDSNACDYMKRSTTWASTICADADAMMRLGKYDYACDALLADSTWCTAICGSTYFEYVLDVKVPTMTSNTTPSGEASGISKYGTTDYDYYKAFDGNSATFWIAGVEANSRIQYKFPAQVSVRKAVITFKYGVSLPSTDVTLQASNDDFTTSTDIKTITVPAGSTTYTTTEVLSNNANYQYYGLSGAFNPSGSWLGVSELQFYGRHTAQTDIIVTAHGGDTVYYMENGSPVPLTTADSDTGIGTVDWSDLPKGAITLYSSTAKNPSDLTADYSKTVYVNENTTQIYLMPYDVAYWLGWETSIAHNDYISKNGSASLPTVSRLTTSISVTEKSNNGNNYGIYILNYNWSVPSGKTIKAYTGTAEGDVGTSTSYPQTSSYTLNGEKTPLLQNAVSSKTLTTAGYIGMAITLSYSNTVIYALWYE